MGAPELAGAYSTPYRGHRARRNDGRLSALSGRQSCGETPFRLGPARSGQGKERVLTGEWAAVRGPKAVSVARKNNSWWFPARSGSLRFAGTTTYKTTPRGGRLSCAGTDSVRHPNGQNGANRAVRRPGGYCYMSGVHLLSTPMPSVPSNTQDLITIAEAARICGWKRANTFREKFLVTEDDAIAMGLCYDADGRALVPVNAVAAAAEKEVAVRAARGNWRLANLKAHRRERPKKRREAPRRNPRRRESARPGTRVD